MRNTRTQAAAITLCTALVTALTVSCTSPGGTTGGESQGMSSSTATDGDAGDTATSATEMTSSSTAAASDGDGMDASGSDAASSTTTSSTSGSPLPGGTGDTAALVATGDLTAGGLVPLLGAGVNTTDPTVAANLCQYLFGTLDQVAEIAELTGDVTLDDVSGRHVSTHESTTGESAPGSASATTAATGAGNSADSTGAAETSGSAGTSGAAGAGDSALIVCVYQSDSHPMLALQIGNGPPVDPDLPGRPIIVDANGMQAVLSYSPDRQGPTIAPQTAREWLGAAADRVAPPTGTK